MSLLGAKNRARLTGFWLETANKTRNRPKGLSRFVPGQSEGQSRKQIEEIKLTFLARETKVEITMESGGSLTLKCSAFKTTAANKVGKEFSVLMDGNAKRASEIGEQLGKVTTGSVIVLTHDKVTRKPPPRESSSAPQGGTGGSKEQQPLTLGKIKPRVVNRRKKRDEE